jgi:hypothetical protein
LLSSLITLLSAALFAAPPGLEVALHLGAEFSEQDTSEGHRDGFQRSDMTHSGTFAASLQHKVIGPLRASWEIGRISGTRHTTESCFYRFGGPSGNEPDNCLPPTVLNSPIWYGDLGAVVSHSFGTIEPFVGVSGGLAKIPSALGGASLEVRALWSAHVGLKIPVRRWRLGIDYVRRIVWNAPIGSAEREPNWHLSQARIWAGLAF